MPKYQYKCETCEYTFEINQGINDIPLNKCPKCKSEIYRVIGTPGVLFNDDGYTQTQLI
jgi:putative FmdB family regulatory protein